MSDGAAPGPDRRPTVIVDDVHITYEVVADKAVEHGAQALFTRLVRPRRASSVEAVRGVSFTAYEGEAVGLLGRNGSGKSSLLRAIAGLVTPNGGRVWADGQPALLGVSGALIRQLSGARNIYLGGLALGLSREQVKQRYDEIADFSGIGEALNRPMSTYSSGMAARLRFAIASAVTPHVLLVDEALATGDKDFRARSQQRIERLRSEAGTVLLVSHSLGTIADTCSRALWLDRGQLLEDGPADQVVAAYRDSGTPRRSAPTL